MEDEVARRRVQRIMGHFPVNEDLPPTRLFPMNCSQGANSVIQRRDSRLLFARQGSESQARYMRQVSIKEDDQNVEERKISQPGEPLFSRPSEISPETRRPEYKPVQRECQLSLEEPPRFSRPYRGIGGPKRRVSDNIRPSGLELAPKMNVQESRYYYVMMVDLPGVSINNVRVEVDEQNLVVTGKRAAQSVRLFCGSNDSVAMYQKRGALHGPPYQIVWPVPRDVNKDLVSAEFVNGVLRITLPKA